MRSSHICTVERLKGESLSSYMYRFAQSNGQALDLKLVVSCSDGKCDQDFLNEHEMARRFADSGVTIPDCDDCDSIGKAAIVPAKFRKSYCYECIAEGLINVKEFAWRLEWRLLYAPYCSIHNTLLRDAPESVALKYDFGRKVFESHWHADSFRERHNVVSEKDSALLALGARCQSTLLLRRSMISVDDRDRFDKFLISLMRALLMPEFHYSYIAHQISSWRGSECFPKYGRNFYVNYFFEIYRVSTFARARAIYLVGLLMGLVTSQEAGAALDYNYHLIYSPDKIWERIDRNSSLKQWFKMDLERYGTSELSESHLLGRKYV